MTEDALTALFVRELREGIEGTGVRAGFLKTAASDTGMTALEEKFLRAAGRAAVETGAAVASHTVLGSTAKKQADILEAISPSIRFVWVHAQAERNRRWHRELAARGVFIEFDALGWTPAEDGTFITAIKELVAAGHGDRVLLSHDAGWYQPGQPRGGTQKPYTYLLGTFVPKLRAAGGRRHHPDADRRESASGLRLFHPVRRTSPTIVSQEMTRLSRREFLRRAATIGMGYASAHALAASDRPRRLATPVSPFSGPAAPCSWSRTWRLTTGPPWRKRRA
jgi:hypothetical protein